MSVRCREHLAYAELLFLRRRETEHRRDFPVPLTAHTPARTRRRLSTFDPCRSRGNAAHHFG